MFSKRLIDKLKLHTFLTNRRMCSCVMKNRIQQLIPKICALNPYTSTNPHATHKSHNSKCPKPSKISRKSLLHIPPKHSASDQRLGSLEGVPTSGREASARSQGVGRRSSCAISGRGLINETLLCGTQDLSTQ